MKHPGEQYLKTMVETGTPVRSVVLLFEKCLFHLAGVRDCLGRGDIAGKAAGLRKAMDIVGYLDNSLDFGTPEAAGPLRESYRLILSRLSRANLQNSLADVQVAEKWLGELHDAWEAIDQHGPVGGGGGKIKNSG
ncbi:flagellar export chaperone FliS [Thiovibrio sp. JS02]